MLSSSESIANSFRQKLAKLSATQNSVETLSHWVKFHEQDRHVLADIWRQESLAAPQKRKLAFLYLANDIVLSSAVFVGVFKDVLAEVIQDAVSTCDKSVHDRIRRCVKIWSSRRVFSPEIIAEFRTRLHGAAPSTSAENLPLDSLQLCLKRCEAEAVEDATAAVAAAPLLVGENGRTLVKSELDVLQRHLSRLKQRKQRTLDLVRALDERLKMERAHVSQCDEEIMTCSAVLGLTAEPKRPRQSSNDSEQTSDSHKKQRL